MILSDFPWLLMGKQMLPILFGCLFKKSMPGLTKNLASVTGLRETTTGEALLKEDEETLIQINLLWNQLRCVTTDSENTCGTESGLDKL